MDKPTKKQIEKWVAALRSGKYQQTKDQLQNEYGYCCLGVACDLFISRKHQARTIDRRFILGTLPSDQFHSPKWLKIVSDYFSTLTGASLAGLNDDGYFDEKLAPFTFDEIADLLELVFLYDALKEEAA